MSSGNADVVLQLPARQQIDLLAQALLREYMHRKGYKGTLAAFDSENPRTEITISSRQLMTQLMQLHKMQDRNRMAASAATSSSASSKKSSQKEPSAANSGGLFSTIMEILCSYRIRKRAIRTIQSGNSDPASLEKLNVFLRTIGCGNEDSSDDEAMQLDAEKHRLLQEASIAAQQKAAEAANTAIANASILAKRDALRLKLEQLQAKTVKLEVFVAKAKKKDGKKGVNKKTADDGNVGNEGKQRSASADDNSSVTSSRRISANSALMNAMSLVSNLPVGTVKHASAQVGRNWVPSVGESAPMVGLASSTSSSSQSGPPVSNSSTPSFLAGNGFHLMADRGARSAAPEWEAPKSKPASLGRRRSADDDDSDGSDVPSPYRLGATVYDPDATRPGILIGASTRRSSTTSAQQRPAGGSPEGGGFQNLAASTTSLSANSSHSGSPTATGSGFHFSASDSPNQPIGTSEKRESSRKGSRRVTIIAE